MPRLRLRRGKPRARKAPSRPVIKIKGRMRPMGTKVEIKGVETTGLVVRDMIASDARSFARYMLRDDYKAKIAMRYETAAEVQKPRPAT